MSTKLCICVGSWGYDDEEQVETIATINPKFAKNKLENYLIF